MIRFLFRLLGFLILAAGFVSLVVDGTRSIASGALVLTSTEASWAMASPDTLARARELIGRLGVPALVDPGLATALALPTCLTLAVLGILLMLVGRRSRPQVGVVP